MNGEVVSVEDPQSARRDWFVAKARSNPAKLDQVKRLWLKASWAIALGMRAGKTFKEMAAEVVPTRRCMFNEAMAYVEPTPKRNPAGTNANDDDFQPGAPRRARGRGRGGNRQYRRRTYGDDPRGNRRGGGGGNRDRRGDRADDRDDCWDDRRDDRQNDRRDDRRDDRDPAWRRGGGSGYRQTYQQWTHDDDRRRQWDSWSQQSGATGGNKRKDDRR